MKMVDFRSCHDAYSIKTIHKTQTISRNRNLSLISPISPLHKTSSKKNTKTKEEKILSVYKTIQISTKHFGKRRNMDQNYSSQSIVQMDFSEENYSQTQHLVTSEEQSQNNQKLLNQITFALSSGKQQWNCLAKTILEKEQSPLPKLDSSKAFNSQQSFLRAKKQFRRSHKLCFSLPHNYKVAQHKTNPIQVPDQKKKRLMHNTMRRNQRQVQRFSCALIRRKSCEGEKFGRLSKKQQFLHQNHPRSFIHQHHNKKKQLANQKGVNPKLAIIKRQRTHQILKHAKVRRTVSARSEREYEIHKGQKSKSSNHMNEVQEINQDLQKLKHLKFTHKNLVKKTSLFGRIRASMIIAPEKKDRKQSIIQQLKDFKQKHDELESFLDEIITTPNQNTGLYSGKTKQVQSSRNVVLDLLVPRQNQITRFVKEANLKIRLPVKVISKLSSTTSASPSSQGSPKSLKLNKIYGSFISNSPILTKPSKQSIFSSQSPINLVREQLAKNETIIYHHGRYNKSCPSLPPMKKQK